VPVLEGSWSHALESTRCCRPVNQLQYHRGCLTTGVPLLAGSCIFQHAPGPSNLALSCMAFLSLLYTTHAPAGCCNMSCGHFVDLLSCCCRTLRMYRHLHPIKCCNSTCLACTRGLSACLQLFTPVASSILAGGLSAVLLSTAVADFANLLIWVCCDS
jgi:hypothetical protein